MNNFMRALPVMLGAAGASAQPVATPPSPLAESQLTWQQCKALAGNNNARLACFDRWAQQQSMPAAAVPAAHAVRIARLEVDQSMPSAGRVAVLDASEKTAAALRDHLQGAGLDAHSFRTTKDLVSAATAAAFAGYVVDWSAVRSKMDSLWPAIRGHQNPCTLILLSDRKRSTAADIADLAQAVVQYKAHVLEKPVQLPLLVSLLQSSLGS